MAFSDEYYLRLAAANERGSLNGVSPLPERLLLDDLDSLSEGELDELFLAGREAGLELYHFKKSHANLPRVRAILGFLHAVPFSSLLDVGSGRGAFLWPCMDAFPEAVITSLDLLPGRVSFLNTVRLGGISRLQARQADLCTYSDDRRFDVVTLLEVLEHILDTAAAVRSAVRLAKRSVVVSVPSKEDDNPEHIHLLTQDVLTRHFSEAGCTRLRFSSVPEHLILIATMERHEEP